MRPDGSVVVLSDGKVLSAKEGKLITDQVVSPTGIAVGADGTIYVANSGKSQNVAVFDTDGKLLRHVGKSGGRPVVG